MLTFDQIKTLPKAVLHDHLDGGLRPATVAELAADEGYQNLPTTDPAALAKWIKDACDSGSLEAYLETFQHTVGVMQSFAAIERVAYECAVDHANDGVVYAEIRFAPELHQLNGLSLDEIVQAVITGFARGEAEMANLGKPIVMRTLLTAMRTAARSTEIAQLAIRWRGKGVVGFDIAGKEAGFPPSRHLDAFDEKNWINKTIKINEAEFKVLKHIPRCSATNLKVNSDQADINLPNQLKKVYGHMDMGIYLYPLDNGKISVHDELIVN